MSAASIALKFWFILLVAPHDGTAGIGAPALMAGPFTSLKLCYGAAALGLDKMADNLTHDFRAVCVADRDILPLRQLYARFEILPDEPKSAAPAIALAPDGGK